MCLGDGSNLVRYILRDNDNPSTGWTVVEMTVDEILYLFHVQGVAPDSNTSPTDRPTEEKRKRRKPRECAIPAGTSPRTVRGTKTSPFEDAGRTLEEC